MGIPLYDKVLFGSKFDKQRINDLDQIPLLNKQSQNFERNDIALNDEEEVKTIKVMSRGEKYRKIAPVLLKLASDISSQGTKVFKKAFKDVLQIAEKVGIGESILEKNSKRIYVDVATNTEVVDESVLLEKNEDHSNLISCIKTKLRDDQRDLE